MQGHIDHLNRFMQARFNAEYLNISPVLNPLSPLEKSYGLGSYVSPGSVCTYLPLLRCFAQITDLLSSFPIRTCLGASFI